MPRGTGQRTYRTEGIVLRGRDLGEADRLVTLITPEYGKVRGVAKGARRLTSKKAGHLEPFCRCTVFLAQGRDLDVIAQVETIDAFPHLRDDLDRLGPAWYLAELTDRFSEEGTEQRALYDDYLTALTALAHGAEPDLVCRWFESTVLILNGLAPSWSVCAGCGAPVQPDTTYAFTLERGGLLCPDCATASLHDLVLDTDAVKVLRLLAREPLARLIHLRMPRTALADAGAALALALRGGLDSELRTLRVLRQLEAPASDPPLSPLGQEHTAPPRTDERAPTNDVQP